MAGDVVPHSGIADARASRAARKKLAFRSVNRRSAPDFQPGMQRHHLLPRQLLSSRCFGALFDRIGRDRIGFDDFRANGLLLPANDQSSVRFGLPMHRGPHRQYNDMVLERVGQIELAWSSLRLKAPEIALEDAMMRLTILQRALRRRLLSPEGRPFKLNRKDPLGTGVDFRELDAMADNLWNGTQTAIQFDGFSGATFAD